MRTKLFTFMALSLLALQANAQFSYSVKAGWSWPEIHNDAVKKKKSSLTFGAGVDYAINEYFGLQSGLSYKRISYVQEYEGGTSNSDDRFTNEAHCLEVPFLFTANVIPTSQRWRAIWNAGMFVDIPVVNSGRKNPKGQTYYGIMAALQIEVLSHYFLRGEYQWALSSDTKDEWSDDRRTNMLSVTLGYRF